MKVKSEIFMQHKQYNVNKSLIECNSSLFKLCVVKCVISFKIDKMYHKLYGKY